MQDSAYLRFKIFAKEKASKCGLTEMTPEVFASAVVESGPNVVTKVLSVVGINLDSLHRDLDKAISVKGPSSCTLSVGLSDASKQVLTFAADCCSNMGDPVVGVQHVFLSLLKRSPVVSMICEGHGVTYASFMNAVKQMISVDQPPGGSKKPPKEMVSDSPMGHAPHDKASKNKPSSDKDILDKYCRDLTKAASNGKLDPVIGREKEMDRVIVTLSRRKKNNPMLTGDPGVGKTSIVEGIAQRIASGLVPEPMKTKRIFCLNMASVVAGTQYRGQFEEKMKNIVEVFRKNPSYILFIDEIHTILGAGGSVGGLDAANIMKPALANGELRCVGATTDEEFKKYFRKDGALERRFQRIPVDEPSDADTIRILDGIKETLEAHHACVISDDAIKASVDLSKRHMFDRKFPDKAIDCLDEACAAFAAKKLAAGERPPVITKDEVAKVVADQSGIPSSVIISSDMQKAASVERRLSESVFGQDGAVRIVSRSIRNAFAGIRHKGKPIGSFVFGGPPSVGKAHVAEVVAKELFSSDDAIIRINMSEYQEGHFQSKLIGSPPGYVGFGEKNQLSDRLLKKPHSVVLLDGIEYAHANIIKLFMRVLSDGMLIDSEGRKVSFQHAIIIMTFGTDAVKKPSQIGFENGPSQSDFDAAQKNVRDACRKRFGDDFVTKIGSFVPFFPLQLANLESIADVMLKDLASRMSENGVSLSFSGSVAASLAASSALNQKASAKDVERAVSERVEDAVSAAMSAGTPEPGDRIVVSTARDGSISAKRRKRARLPAASAS